MNRYLLRQALSIILLPGIVTAAIPTIIAWQTHQIHIAWGLSLPLSIAPITVGLLVFIGGLVLMFQTISLFITVGKGTLAPWDATQKLVIRGPYRYVRNPMICGVFAILLGESIILGSVPILGWLFFVVLLNMVYIPPSEEPGLLKRFGEEYITYKRHVPRWIPRLKPWDGHVEGW